MPGGDGTGPMGAGAITGRGLGRGRFFRGGRLGYRPMRGYSQGFTACYGNPAVQELTAKQEADMLKKEAKLLQDEVNALNQRVKELESADKGK